ncbi:MAG: hypothetical protein ABGX16_16080 [Pirellulales bacterium]
MLFTERGLPEVPRRLNILLMFMLVTACTKPQPPQLPPYPPSQTIASWTLDFSTHVRRAQGSDNWPLTWSDDGHQYTAFGDGGGFKGTNSVGRVSLGFARLQGHANDYSGHNLWGGKDAPQAAQFNGKSYGILSLDGVLYAWVGPGSGTESYREARLYRSPDKSQSWQPASWSFEADDGIIMPTILNYGCDNAKARDSFVYHYFIGLANIHSTKLAVQKPGAIYLARVSANHLFTSRDDYRWFAGKDTIGIPQWIAEPAERHPVFEDANGVGWNLSVSYNSGLKRYLLATEHTATCEGNLGLFDAPEPWGPWTVVAYHDHGQRNAFGAETDVASTTFYWNFAPAWISDNGENFTLVFTGIGENDSWNSVQGRFTLHGLTPH